MVPPRPNKEAAVSTKSQIRISYSGRAFMLISLVLYICLPGLSCYAFRSYVHRGLSHRCFLICSVALFTWFFDFFFPEQFRTPCWVTTSFKWFKLLSTIQPDCNSQGGIDLGRLQLGNHWSLILLFCEQ